MDISFQQEIDELKTQADSAGLPPSMQIKIQRMLAELQRSVGATNYFETSERIKHYVDWVTKVPWHKGTVDQLDLLRAKEIMDSKHYGLEDMKTRLLEYLAVIKLNEAQQTAMTLRAPTLLLVGQAGTGKTTFAKVIAEAMGRNFVRIPFGGLGSARDLRGQSRLHLEAEPGLIVKSIIRAGSINPVLLLDEVDRVAEEARADIMGVLLELLDPEQNAAFVDHYMDFPIDLSKVLFVATCNNTTHIATAVMDRMEPLMMPSYNDMEKMMIAKNYLLPRAMQEANLPTSLIQIDDSVWASVIRPLGYDSGIRTLQRTVQGIVRKTAKLYVEGKIQSVVLTPENVKEFLPSYRTELL